MTMSLGRECIPALKEAVPAVLPSLLLCDFGNLEREIELLEDAGVAGLHLDVMDGVFVPNFTYGMTIISALRKLTDLPLDVHLMMVQPEKYIEAFRDAGADMITVHAEATEDACGLINQIKELGVGAGIAVNPDTPTKKIEDALPHADMALVMSVHGQSFIEPVLDKFDEIRGMPGGEALILEIDGGINASTIGVATERGAQLLVAGSAIFNQDDYSVAMESMMAQVKHNQ
ncbi:ribulose-phosphate 3-epimerase [bacterium]|nr:ribulose-phosphate 3-epimerase [bacterium]